MTNLISKFVPKPESTHGQGFSKLLATVGLLAISSTAFAAPQTSFNLYMDSNTKQVFTEPGPNRIKLGTFEAVSEESQKRITKLEEQQKAQSQLEVGKKGLVVKSGNGDFSMNLGGRIQADASIHSNDDLQKRSNGDPVEAVSGTEIRRARLALKGTFNRDFGYVIEGDWGGNSVSMKDVFVVYHATPNLEFTVGNQKHALSMEVQESSNDIMFNERSLLTGLTLPHFDRAIGLNAKTMGENWSLQGGIYGDAISSSGNGADEGGGVAMRGTFAPINEAGKLLHIGANLGMRKANDNNSLSNSKTPRLRYETTNMSDFYLTDTGSIAGFDEIQLSGFELAAMLGRFSAQAEFGQADISRDGGSDLSFDAHYLQFGWSLTGEARTYKGSDGEFKKLKARNNFNPSQNNWGAWELALRMDELDLGDEDIQGGSQKRLSLNLNWYLNDNLRVLMGYSRSYDVESSPVIQIGGGEPDNIDVISIRTQLSL
ncbi:OprO/OprP family phosphate-selective porin [Zhongshania sp. BJYM1]|uniref:OprO/OprP family phosphate-selective porin n=1 Tax=Zhongshania aquatica TaxID=2965069 RepID=UPI0022B51623|nr:porin [Marortus sp. BJYM1]